RPGLKFGCFCSVLIPHGHVRTPLQTHTWRKQNANPLTNRFRSTGWSVERYWIVRRILPVRYRRSGPKSDRADRFLLSVSPAGHSSRPNVPIQLLAAGFVPSMLGRELFARDGDIPQHGSFLTSSG